MQEIQANAGDKAEGAGAEPSQPVMPPTSRICVKNIPKHADEHRLRDHFSQKGEVTDAKVMRTRDGRSRCFGFVGFASADQASSAVAYFNKSFMDAMRLEVEFAYKYGSSGVGPKAWSKYTEGTSAHRRLAQATGANDAPLGERAKSAKKIKQPNPEEKDPKLKEFLNLMAPRSKKAIWSNDDELAAAAAAAAAAAPAPEGVDEVVLEDDGGSDDELYEDIPGQDSSREDEEGSSDDDDGGASDGAHDPVVADVGVSDLDYLKARVKANFSDEDEAEDDGVDGDDEDIEGIEDESSESESEAADDSGGASEGEEDEEEAHGGTAAAAAAAADDDDAIDALFQRRTKSKAAARQGSASDAEVDEDDDDGERGERGDRGGGRYGHADPAAVIGETGRLFVRNLPYTATEGDLRAVFDAHGEVDSVHIVLDKATRRSKGYALVQFASAADAVAAHAALDGSIFMGRLMHVIPGQRAPAQEAPEGQADGVDARGAAGGGTSSYKRKKGEELKASAGNRAAWNSLFMRPDTVAEAVAAHYGVSKADLLDPHAADMAVRLALGETQVIAQTKASLAEAGVNVDALEAAAAGGKGKNRDDARSDRVLLVKNLPYAADESELEAMFAVAGPIARLVLPVTRTLALIEFTEAQDARKAFKALAYKRYQSVPIYLEWAPAKIFAAVAKQQQKKGDGAALVPAPAAELARKGKAAPTEPTAADVAAGLAPTGAGDDAVESSTVYVKNLSFSTDEASLEAHFAEAAGAAGGEGAMRSVKVARRKGKDGRMMSAGFGFIECSSESVARATIDALQGSSLDGHRLVLQLAQQQKGSGADQKSKEKGSALALPAGQESTKIVVRNVAFEATRKDILGLFTPFGEVKSCRLPRKFDGTHRGFAFVEFATRQEARTAVEAVAGTHLYGRRLVIEWAAEDGGLDELRAKTADKYRGDTAALQGGDGVAGGEEGEGEGDGRRKRHKRG